MNLLLKKYIANYLKEAASTAISMGASDVTGQSQHSHAASYKNDMTRIDDDEVLLKVLENVGDNCFISFVDDYDEDIPRLEISPTVKYDTPHGNYAYPLTAKSLKEIVDNSSIGEARFAIDRPYFHLFKKSNSLNSVDIQPDGSNNYSGNYIEDLRTIVHTAVMFNTAKNLERNPSKYITKLADDDENRAIKFDSIKRRISRKIKANSTPSHARDSIFNKTMFSLSEELCYLFNLNNKTFPREVVKLIVDYLTKAMEFKIKSTQNKFFVSIEGERKLLSKFHGLFYACFLLSKSMSDDLDIFEDDDPNAFDVNKINSPQENKVRQGSIFTMLLNSIDIDFIHDKGSRTLHGCEPIQAVYLNSSKKESVSLIGTFNNIFYNSSKNPFALLGSANLKTNLKNKKSVTMDKIVNIVSSNKHLASLFNTPLFDDPKLEGSVEELRKKAWQDLNKKPLKISKLKYFNSVSKIIRLNMYQQSEYSSNPGLIIFDIGFKKSFKDADINQQLLMIRDDLPKILQIQGTFTYLQVFLSKYSKKNVYEILGMSALENMTKTLDKIQDYVANVEIDSDEDKELIMSLNLFIYNVEDIIHLASIAHDSTLNNS